MGTIASCKLTILLYIKKVKSDHDSRGQGPIEEKYDHHLAFRGLTFPFLSFFFLHKCGSFGSGGHWSIALLFNQRTSIHILVKHITHEVYFGCAHLRKRLQAELHHPRYRQSKPTPRLLKSNLT